MILVLRAPERKPLAAAPTISISNDGVFTLNASSSVGCTVTGTVRVVHPEYNYYRFTGNQSSCSATTDGPVKGFMYLGDLSGKVNNYLRMFVQSRNETGGTWVGASK